MSPSPPATPTRGRPILTVDRAGCAPLLSLEVDRGRPDRLWYRSAVVDPPLGAGIRDGGGWPGAFRLRRTARRARPGEEVAQQSGPGAQEDVEQGGDAGGEHKAAPQRAALEQAPR